MARSQSSKRQMEKNRREKAAAKRVRRDERAAAGPEDGEGVVVELTPQDEILAALAEVHELYAKGDLSLDDFEIRKEELVGRLRVE